jgi:NAD-dependent dihydropyrimidine dehydrogenase PreA subunit
VRWGPADLHDLPAFLDRGCHVRRTERKVRFASRARLEMGAIWTSWTAAIAGLLGAWLGGWRLGAALATGIGAAVLGLFAAIPWAPVTGRARWLTCAGFAASGAAVAAGVLAAAGAADPVRLGVCSAVLVGVMLLVSVDLPGMTPLYASAINTRRGAPAIDLDVDRCTGAGECVQVCPRDVLAMDGRRRKVEIARPDDCVSCGACVVQCPEDALRFRYPDGRIVEPRTIRTTRLNLLGDRTIPAREAERSAFGKRPGRHS